MCNYMYRFFFHCLFINIYALMLILVVFPSCTKQPSLIFATTTSVQDSGLLDELIPLFEKESGIKVKVIAVGSGKAMALGKRGEADIILAHAPADEEAFMNEGYGTRRRALMKNDFLIVGPADDPANITNVKTPEEAFRAIAQHGARFVSRADNSGTHFVERALWKKAGVVPDGQKWYQESGLGMGETLSIASEKRAYTIADRATWIALKRNLSLTVLWEGKDTLSNVYSLIEVNPALFPRVKSKEAAHFAEFLFSQNAQDAIASFGKKSFGEALFVPMGKNEQK